MTAKGARASASMAASWMELPKTTSGWGRSTRCEGERLALVCGDIDERAGDEAVDDGDARGEDALGRDAEVADAFFNDPVVGGADGPDFAAGGA